MISFYLVELRILHSELRIPMISIPHIQYACVVVALHLVYVVSQYSYFMWFLFGLSHDHNIVSHDYNKLHKYVQVQLLYVVGAECISLYLGSTKNPTEQACGIR